MPGEKTRLYAVSIDASDKAQQMIKKIESDKKGKIEFQLLSDKDAKIIDLYNLRDERYAAEQVSGIPRPTVMIVTKNRKIAWILIEGDYKKRPLLAEIRAELDKLK